MTIVIVEHHPARLGPHEWDRARSVDEASDIVAQAARLNCASEPLEPDAIDTGRPVMVSPDRTQSYP